MGHEIRKEDLAASFQHVAVESIIIKTKQALETEHIPRLIIAGGVAANKGLRQAAQAMCEQLGVKLSIPPFLFCTDNAAMIASAGYYAYQLGRRASYDLNSYSSLPLQ